MTTLQSLFSAPKTHHNGHATLIATESAQPATSPTPAPATDYYALGYEKAEQHRGEPRALDNLLNRLLNGHLVEERDHEARRLQQRQRNEVQRVEFDKQIERVRTDVRKLTDTELPALRDKHDDCAEQIRQIRRDEAEGKRIPDHRNRILTRFYGVLVGLLTGFVYLFYVSAFYSAFYRDLATELANAGQAGVTAVLSAIFAKAAFRNLDLHWVAAVLPFAFGGALHVLWAYHTRAARVLLGVGIAVVLGTDGLIAYFIEAKNHDVKVLMGLADATDNVWYAAPVFWLVLAMGFVAAMIWSLLLHAWLHELGKRDVARLAALDILLLREKQADLRQQTDERNTRLADLEGQIATLELDRRALDKADEQILFSRSELEKYVAEFYDGWLIYINNRMGNDTARREACEAVVRAFYAAQFGNSGPNTLAWYE